VIFDWDENKEKENIRKHRITFVEASRAFSDQNAVFLFDESNSDDEIRYQIIALSPFRLLFVAYTVREAIDEEVYRIISARKADKDEVKFYNEQNR
jgi:uncharacterized protein